MSITDLRAHGPDEPDEPDAPSQAAAASGLRRLARLTKFGLVGGSGVLVNMLVFQLVHAALPASAAGAWRLGVANLCGILLSILTNFLLNDAWTWGDRVKGRGFLWFKRLGRYYVTCSIAGVVQLVTAQLALAHLFGPWAPQLAGVALAPGLSVASGILAGIAINFPVSHLWAFKDEASDVDERS